MHVKTGDKVQVMTGPEKKKIGKVLKVFPKKNRVIVEGVNIGKKHIKPRAMNQQGGIVEEERSIHASNVLLYDEKLGRGVRTKVVMDNGKKVRVSVKSDTRFDK